jgi:orotidine-5'-phosphate decarboxylase
VERGAAPETAPATETATEPATEAGWESGTEAGTEPGAEPEAAPATGRGVVSGAAAARPREDAAARHRGTGVSALESPRPAQREPALERLLAREALIVALDFPSAPPALDLVERLEGQCSWFKVGLELYLAEGNALVRELVGRGCSVFLDLKLCDIPNTVAGAVRSASALGVRLFTLHAAGGPLMMAAAREAAGSSPEAPQLLAVTVLTSMDQQQLIATGVKGTPAVQALRLGSLALECGMDGLVCSAEEVAALRSLSPVTQLVVPGIRPADSAAGDQKRIATPAAAIRAGASRLVVGRPISRAADPAQAASRILEAMAGAFARLLPGANRKAQTPGIK